VNFTTRYLEATPKDELPQVGELVECIIRDGMHAGASDIHIEPWEHSVVARIRLNGVLTILAHLPLELKDKIPARFKVMANLVTHQPGLPQEGHASLPPGFEGMQLRVSVFPVVRGEKVVARILNTRARSFDLQKLGLEADTLSDLLHLLSRPSGLIFLTGPTGSGKTTAIYAALNHLVQKHGPTVSISSIEDPVEYSLAMVSQSQVNPAQDFTYAAALRSLMRQDPQVIMVGEVRDAETAAIAVQAGLTGHLVISTIHSGTTAGVFARLINMEIEPFLLASSVIGVLGLRLVRLNCPACAAPCAPDPALLQSLPEHVREGGRFLRGKGCDQCLGTGYQGRTALAEVLKVDEPLREAILQKMPTRALQEVAVGRGMRTLWDLGLRRAAAGLTTLEEVARVIASDQL
jgi:type II secretory ATPase GspE/PulE/Tfp pilus assembly ATPase PilB-like protein